jgi:hypothetical protein
MKNGISHVASTFLASAVIALGLGGCGAAPEGDSAEQQSPEPAASATPDELAASPTVTASYSGLGSAPITVKVSASNFTVGHKVEIGVYDAYWKAWLAKETKTVPSTGKLTGSYDVCGVVGYARARVRDTTNNLIINATTTVPGCIY